MAGEADTCMRLHHERKRADVCVSCAHAAVHYGADRLHGVSALCRHSLAGVNACCCGGDISCPLPGHGRRDESSPRGEEAGDAAGDNGTGTPEPTAGGKAKLLA